MSVSESWSRVERWLADNCRSQLEALRPPAELAVLRQLEQAIGQPLPGQLHDWLRMHDGQDPDRWPVLRPWELLSCEAILRAWRLHESTPSEQRPQAIATEGPVAAVWWSAGWIPFASNGAGDLLCVDCAAPAGHAGQVVEFRHDQGLRRVIAEALDCWLSRYADALEAGRYTCDEILGLMAVDAADEELE